MELSALALLFAASFVNAAAPGPCMLLTFGRTVRAGPGAGVAVSLGVLSADLVLVATAFGVAAGMVALTPGGLGAMKWIGVALLCGLAAYCLRVAPAGPGLPGRDGAAGFTVGLTSPYNLVFYLALLPQVMPTEPTAASTLAMAVTTLSAIALAQAGAVALAVGWGAAAGRPGRWVDYASAAMMMAVAVTAATMPVGGAGDPTDAATMVSAR